MSTPSTRSTADSGAVQELPPAAPSQGTLLVVDDEEGPRLSLKLVFKDDYNLLMASSGPEAVELARQHKIDVALLDIRMAGMSGIEVLERLRYVDPDIQVVMMTAFETTDTIRQALRLQACDYLNKPFDVATMRAAVSAAMQRRALQGTVQDNEEQIQQLATELQNQMMEGERARTRGDVFASILHDINGPLTVISGFAQNIALRLEQAQKVEGAELEYVRDRLKTITRQVANCVEIQQRYRGLLSKAKEGVIPRTGINQALVDVQHLLRVHPSREGHDLAVQPLTRDITVQMNGTDVIQMLLNLGVNGFQCSPAPHGVYVSGEVLDAPANLEVFKEGPHDRVLNLENFENVAPLVCLTVRDTGPGIPGDVLPRIFQPYFTTKGPKQGTGLGLSIVGRLLKEAKGALRVHSVVGEGTRFDIYLKGQLAGTSSAH